MEFYFRRRTKADIQEFLSWHFEGVYAFYNNDSQQEKIDWYINSVENENAFSVFNEKEELIGNCEYSLDDGAYVMGLQMKPELTGMGMGKVFSNAVIEFGRAKYQFCELYLAVAAFNERAATVYRSLGFTVIEETIWTIREKDYEFLIMKKQF